MKVIKNGSVSVRFFKDGTMLRNDVRLDVATRLSVTEAAKVLNRTESEIK